MRNVRNNNLIKKIAIIILFIMCINLLIPNVKLVAYTYDIETTEDNRTPGGSLFQPIMDFLIFLADSVLNILQHNFITMHDVVYSTNGGEGSFNVGWLVAPLIGLVAIGYGIACVYTGGAALALIVVGCITTVAGGVATVTSVKKIVDLANGEFDMPFIMYNPYAIFSGEVPALDINFINPRESVFSEAQDDRNDITSEFNTWRSNQDVNLKEIEMQQYLNEKYSQHIEKYNNDNSPDKAYSFDENTYGRYDSTSYEMKYKWKENETLYELILFLGVR